MELLFSEELGLVLEVSERDVETVRQRFSQASVQCLQIGKTCGFGPEATVRPEVECPVFACAVLRIHSHFFNFSGQSLCRRRGGAERTASQTQSIVGGHQFPA